MNSIPALACGPDGSILLLFAAIIGGGGLLCAGSMVAGIVCLCKTRKTLGLWLIFLPMLLVAAVLGWLQGH